MFQKMLKSLVYWEYKSWMAQHLLGKDFKYILLVQWMTKHTLLPEQTKSSDISFKDLQGQWWFSKKQIVTALVMYYIALWYITNGGTVCFFESNLFQYDDLSNLENIKYKLYYIIDTKVMAKVYVSLWINHMCCLLVDILTWKMEQQKF